MLQNCCVVCSIVFLKLECIFENEQETFATIFICRYYQYICKEIT